MKQTTIPGPREILERHQSLLRMIVVGLQRGTIHAQAYAEWQHEAVDRYLAPALVRKDAKRFLLTHGQHVADEEQGDVADLGPVPEYKTENLSNIGLALSAPGVRIRILRSDHGDPPVPGPSKARQQFYAQQGVFQFDARPEVEINRTVVVEADVSGATINLVVHWETDDNYNLDRVSLACPQAGGTTRQSVQTHWNRSFWRRRSQDEAIAEAEVSDLDISLDDAEEGTGTEE